MQRSRTGNNSKLHICITVAVMIFIFVQSALPGDMSGAESNVIVQFIAGITGWNEEVLRIVVRKAAHFTEYLVLGVCLSVNMQDLMKSRKAFGEGSLQTDIAENVQNVRIDSGKYLLAAWLIGTAYAVTDEIHQLFVPDRVCSLMDVCIDSAGVACGVVLFYIYNQVKTLSKKRAENEI